MTSRVAISGKVAGIASAVVVIVIIAAGFLVTVPVATAVAFPVVVVNTSTVTYTTSSTTQVPVTNQVQTSQSIFVVGATIVPANNYLYSSAQVNSGTDANVRWTSDDTVDVYIFDSAQYSAYASGGTTSPNIATQTGQASGTLGWHATFSDTYYVVLHNPHNGFFGIGSHSITVSTTGSESYLASQTTYISQVVTYTTSSETLVSSTTTSTTTKSCSYVFWIWVAGSRSCS